MTEEQAAELAARDVKQYQARRAAADRVAELEELKGHGPLTEEQEAELAELQSKMAGWKQHTKGRSATYRQGLRAAADRVVVLEELAGRGS
ncbi:hypothetical protein [Saccharopolyspora spinosa]|uniref:hypothetical protein n=1 Tax=Saccharopolyspora spinosa TaxID=60894 RepID=UPI00376EB2C1